MELTDFKWDNICEGPVIVNYLKTMSVLDEKPIANNEKTVC